MNELAVSSIEERIRELAQEERYLNEMGIGQVGTEIPQLYSLTNTFILNPSNVGTSVLARMIETDDTVSSAVQFKILMVLAKIGEYHHDKPEISDFINDVLKKLLRPTWAESMESMLSSTGYGFSVSEPCFALTNDLKKVPVRIPTYHPSTLGFEVDRSGQITPDGVVQFVQMYSQFSNPNGMYQWIGNGFTVKNPFTTPNDRLYPYRLPFMNQYGMVRIPRAKVIHHTNLPMLAFGSPYGKTAVRTAHLAWQLKVFFMRQMGIAGKRQAGPFLWGTAPQGANNVKVKLPDGREETMTPSEAMRVMLRDRETDDHLVTGPESSGYKVEAIQGGANMDQFINVINMLDVRMFRAFLMPSLVMTDGSAGNRALGDKHFQIVDRIAEKDAEKFGATVVNDLITRVITDNFGRQDDYGYFKKRPQNLEERERLANMYATLTTAGIMRTHVPEDMDYMRAELSLPKDADPSFNIVPPAEKAVGDGDSGDAEPSGGSKE